MNIQSISVYKIHEYITGRPPSTESFSDRIIAQKVIYLADALGAYAGDYSWNWYKKGPYSPALTDVLYNLNTTDDIYSFMLKEEIKYQLNPLREIFNSRPNNLTEADWMELLASIHYLYYKTATPKKLTDITQKLLLHKPKYSAEQARNAFSILENYRFIA